MAVAFYDFIGAHRFLLKLEARHAGWRSLTQRIGDFYTCATLPKDPV